MRSRAAQEASNSRAGTPQSCRSCRSARFPTPGKLEHLAAAGCTEVVLRVPTGDTSEMLRCLDDLQDIPRIRVVVRWLSSQKPIMAGTRRLRTRGPELGISRRCSSGDW